MYLPAIMAFLHHVAAFTVVTALGVEVALFKPPLTAIQARRVILTDTLFGVSATALLIVGLLRVFFFEKGAAYYFSNPFFLVKLSLFVSAALTWHVCLHPHAPAIHGRATHPRATAPLARHFDAPPASAVLCKVRAPRMRPCQWTPADREIER